MLDERITHLNSASTSEQASTVVYVMSRDQRANDNHALLTAQQKAKELQLPLVVVFFLHAKSGYRSREFYKFMLAGLKETQSQLEDFNIAFEMYVGSMLDNNCGNLTQLKPAHVYFDFSPLDRPQREQKQVASNLDTPCSVVDTHNIIPALFASDHQEFAARTFRPKISKHLANFLQEPAKVCKHPHTYTGKKTVIDVTATNILQGLDSNGLEIDFTPGSKSAHQRVANFIDNGLQNFAKDRNDPTKDTLTNLSPYLHFGQISSLRVCLEVLKNVKADPSLFTEAKMPQANATPNKQDGMNVLFEEIIVRKELSDNFCYYAQSYTDFSSIPGWASNTLREHESDKREFTYSRPQWEHAKTHDPAWNAAQNQLIKTGKIHGYMRMYWAKKMLEWSDSPKQALRDCIYLNDTYSIDGGDPNGYVGILWSIAGLHDRAWTERPVFGKVRYMNASGLKRKFDIEQYIKQWQ